MNRIAAIFPTADAVTLGPLAALFADNPRLPVQMLAFCAVFLYFFLFWRKLGPAPAKGAITPRSCPPVAGQLCRETSADASPLSPWLWIICATPPASAAVAWPPPFWT